MASDSLEAADIVLHPDRITSILYGKKGGFSPDGCQFRSGPPCCSRSDILVRECAACKMPRCSLSQDIESVVFIRGGKLNLPVEATWPAQRDVQILWAIRRCNYNDIRVGLEAIHEGKQLCHGPS